MKVLNFGLLFGLALGSLVSCSHQPVHTTEVAEIDDAAYGRLPSSECYEFGKTYKECKQARKNDTADKYLLDHEGNLFRKVPKVKTPCQITSDVSDFKISQHPNDVAVLYYKKGNDLYIFNKDKEYRPNGQCPSAKGNSKMLMANVQKFTVTSNQNTTIVNAAVDVNGNFNAWDNNIVVYSDKGIDEFQMNSCYGTQGKSFSSYVLFTRDYQGNVTKVKTDGTYFVKDASKVDPRRYNGLTDFKKQNNVCN